jgi:hypothetical protein
MYSLRRSSVSWGMTHRMMLPSLEGLTPEVGLLDRLLDGVHRALVEGADDDGACLGRLEGRELLQRGRRAVVVDEELLEHSRVRATGADAGRSAPWRPRRPSPSSPRPRTGSRRSSALSVSFVAPVRPGFVRALRALVRAQVPVSQTRQRCCRGRQLGETSVPIRSPRRARVMSPSPSMPKTTIGSLFSMHRLKAAASTTLRPERSASVKLSRS